MMMLNKTTCTFPSFSVFYKVVPFVFIGLLAACSSSSNTSEDADLNTDISENDDPIDNNEATEKSVINSLSSACVSVDENFELNAELVEEGSEATTDVTALVETSYSNTDIVTEISRGDGAIVLSLTEQDILAISTSYEGINSDPIYISAFSPETTGAAVIMKKTIDDNSCLYALRLEDDNSKCLVRSLAGSNANSSEAAWSVNGADNAWSFEANNCELSTTGDIIVKEL